MKVTYTNTRSEATKPSPTGKVWMGVKHSVTSSRQKRLHEGAFFVGKR